MNVVRMTKSTAPDLLKKRINEIRIGKFESECFVSCENYVDKIECEKICLTKSKQAAVENMTEENKCI